MRFCDADACIDCSLAHQAGMAACLRQKAQFCMWLSTTRPLEARAALEKLSLELMEDASAIEKENRNLADAVNRRKASDSRV
jgi:hypothetical protein